VVVRCRPRFTVCHDDVSPIEGSLNVCYWTMCPLDVTFLRRHVKGFFIFYFRYVIQHCFIFRPSDSTLSEDAAIEPRTVATLALTARRSNHSAKSHPQRRYVQSIKSFMAGRCSVMVRRCSVWCGVAQYGAALLSW
jgi:hypothetical protein